MDATATTLHTDEWIDRRLSRPAARALVRILRRTPLTANQVTCLSGLSGIAAGVGLGLATPASLLFAAASILGALVFDCADGQLARIRGGGSRTGRVLDGACDYVTGLSLHVGAIVYVLRTGHAEFPALPAPIEVTLVVLTGILLAFRAAILDDLKGRVRRRLGTARDERDDPAQIREEISREKSAAVRALLGAYLLYCRLQVRGRRQPALEASNPRAIRAEATALRGWSFLGPSSHLFAMAVAAALGARWPDAIRAYFLIAVGPMTLAMVALLLLARRR